MTLVQYFAYGSNMLTERLSARCASARPIGVAYASDYALQFSKKSNDTSGKATLVKRKGARQFGVLFHINSDEMGALDDAESRGVGYKRHDTFQVNCAFEGKVVSAITYLAIKTDSQLTPFDWYLALVIAGAKQHILPTEQILEFQQILSVKDPNCDRKGRCDALIALLKAGFGSPEDILTTNKFNS